jgi:hypothetical protein
MNFPICFVSYVYKFNQCSTNFKMPKRLDPMWEYGLPYDGHNRMRLNCKLCGMEMFGGISRLKYHLAKIPGNEVGICPTSALEIVHIANQSIFDIIGKRDQREETRLEFANKNASFSTVGKSQSSDSPSTMPNPSASSPFSVLRSMPRGQPSIRSIVKTKEEAEADKIVPSYFVWCTIPFNIARNNPFYYSMFEATSIVGVGYKGPSYNDLRELLLQGEKVDCTKRLGELRESWEIKGCTIMSNGWIDVKGRSILNFLVNCPRGTMFIKSVDAFVYVKNAQLLHELLDDLVREIDP